MLEWSIISGSGDRGTVSWSKFTRIGATGKFRFAAAVVAVVLSSAPFIAIVPASATPPPGYGTGPSYCTQYAGGVATYSFDNVYACDGTTTGSTKFDAPGSGVYAWQCVELSARFLWAIYGIWAGPGAGINSGYQVVSVVHASHPSIGVGYPGPGSVPVAGDILSLGPYGGTGSSDGHTAVVIAANPTSGQFTIMSQNAPDGRAGLQTLQVDLSGSHDGKVDFFGTWTIASWLTLSSGTQTSVATSQMVSGALSRYAGPSGHISTTGPAPSGYTYESTFGSLLTTSEPGTVELYLCLMGTDYFTSSASNCEGQSVVRAEGWAYTSPPSGVPSMALYRCRVTSSGTHFDSPDLNCEGQSVDAGLLGYLVATSLSSPSVTSPTTTTITPSVTSTTESVSVTTTLSTPTVTTTSVVKLRVPKKLRVDAMVVHVSTKLTPHHHRVTLWVIGLPKSSAGMLQFSLSGRRLCKSSVSRGNARCSAILTLSRGTYVIVARFSGDKRYLPYTSRTRFVISL